MCSDFLAGDMLRSSQRYKALDETAVFGTACRHEFPHRFINLKHGERLCYGVWLLNEIVERQPEGIKIYLMYDIACNLVCHLKVLFALFYKMSIEHLSCRQMVVKSC
jgi:hypothetical protein